MENKHSEFFEKYTKWTKKDDRQKNAFFIVYVCERLIKSTTCIEMLYTFEKSHVISQKEKIKILNMLTGKNLLEVYDTDNRYSDSDYLNMLLLKIKEENDKENNLDFKIEEFRKNYKTNNLDYERKTEDGFAYFMVQILKVLFFCDTKDDIERVFNGLGLSYKEKTNILAIIMGYDWFSIDDYNLSDEKRYEVEITTFKAGQWKIALDL